MVLTAYPTRGFDIKTLIVWKTKWVLLSVVNVSGHQLAGRDHKNGHVMLCWIGLSMRNGLDRWAKKGLHLERQMARMECRTEAPVIYWVVVVGEAVFVTIWLKLPHDTVRALCFLGSWIPDFLTVRLDSGLNWSPQIQFLKLIYRH